MADLHWIQYAALTAGVAGFGLSLWNALSKAAESRPYVRILPEDDVLGDRLEVSVRNNHRKPIAIWRVQLLQTADQIGFSWNTGDEIVTKWRDKSRPQIILPGKTVHGFIVGADGGEGFWLAMSWCVESNWSLPRFPIVIARTKKEVARLVASVVIGRSTS